MSSSSEGTRSASQCLPAFRDSLPVLMGYIPLGVVFGFLFVQAGGTPAMAALASVLVYGGASQYMMVPMVAAGLPVLSIAFATAVINLRHIFYGISLLHKVPAHGWQRWFIAFTLTDETYSLLSSYPNDVALSRMVWLAFFDWMWWIVGSFLGAVLGAAAQTDLAGIDFVLTSLFAMLACEQWRNRMSAWPLWSALAAYAVARFSFPQQALALSIALCVIAGLVWGAGRRRNTSAADKEGSHDAVA